MRLVCLLLSAVLFVLLSLAGLFFFLLNELSGVIVGPCGGVNPRSAAAVTPGVLMLWYENKLASAAALQGVKLQLFWHVRARKRNPGKSHRSTLTRRRQREEKCIFSLSLSPDSDLMPGCHGPRTRVGALSVLDKLPESRWGCSCCWLTEQNGRLL